MFGKVAPVMLSSTVFADVAKGPTFGNDHCSEGLFDDWNDHGYAGNVSKVCVAVGAPKKRDHDAWIIRFQACYIGSFGEQCAQHPNAGSPANECFELDHLGGEVITKIDGYSGNGMYSFTWVAGMQIHTNSGRSSKLFGRQTDEHKEIAAPEDYHIASFFGCGVDSHTGWAGTVNQIGVFFEAEPITPVPKQCEDLQVYGYWRDVAMKGVGSETITTKSGVTNADGTGGSSETMKSLSNTHGESFTYGMALPALVGGFHWDISQSWSVTTSDSESVSSSWSKMKTTTYEEECSRTFSGDDGGHVYQWVWAYECNDTSLLPTGQAYAACSSIILLPFTCGADSQKCQPRFGPPENCKDQYCQTGYQGARDLKTGEVVSSQISMV